MYFNQIRGSQFNNIYYINNEHFVQCANNTWFFLIQYSYYTTAYTVCAIHKFQLILKIRLFFIYKIRLFDYKRVKCMLDIN